MANNIVSLIRKDFFALWSERMMGPMFVALLAISAAFASYLTFSSLVFVLMTVSSYTLNVFTLEEKFRTERFFASLPVRRRDIVLARYGEIFVIAGVYFIAAYLANALSFLAGKTPAPLIPPGYCAAVLVIVAFMTSLTFPLYFKLGVAKAKTATTLILAAFMALAVAMTAMLWSEGSYPAAKAIQSVLNSPFPRDLPHILLLVGAAILLWGVSIPVAVTLYSRRDF